MLYMCIGHAFNYCSVVYLFLWVEFIWYEYLRGRPSIIARMQFDIFAVSGWRQYAPDCVLP